VAHIFVCSFVVNSRVYLKLNVLIMARSILKTKTDELDYHHGELVNLSLC
jgi:hypothetical protein